MSFSKDCAESIYHQKLAPLVPLVLQILAESLFIVAHPSMNEIWRDCNEMWTHLGCQSDKDGPIDTRTSDG